MIFIVAGFSAVLYFNFPKGFLGILLFSSTFPEYKWKKYMFSLIIRRIFDVKMSFYEIFFNQISET